MANIQIKPVDDFGSPNLIGFADFLNPHHVMRAYMNGDAEDDEGRPIVENAAVFEYEFANLNSQCCKYHFKNCRFYNCKFTRCNYENAVFENCVLVECLIEDCVGTIHDVEKIGMDEPVREAPMLTNEEIEARYKCKCKTLQNKKFVKCIFTCDFCHKDTVAIYSRAHVRSPLQDVPNCDRKVCRECYASYNLTDKFYGHRHYGYAGPVSRFTTPIDKEHTVILGLEMEFEGDFYGWKELQDAHKGYLHYGYDSSVDGQNELSWDCGSYSWWKYIAPLKDVCNALKKNGGRAGDTAGIHIHASVDNMRMRELAHKINIKCRSGKWNALMKAVSMRNNLEKFNRYANLELPETEHHAGISYNGHGTVEFRIFNSSVDHNEILHMLKFVKETFMFFANGRKKVIYSPESKSFIIRCANAQLKKGFITETEFNQIKREFL